MIKVLILLILVMTSVQGNSEEVFSFEEAETKVKQTPPWIYPYPELVDQLKKERKRSIPIFSYGSLMDEGSAKQTLGGKSMQTRRPAIAYHLRRVFDRDVKVRSKSKWCIPMNPEARGMLNVIPTESKEDFINGVLVDITLDDIPNVLFREEGYDLIPVVVQDWHEVADVNPNYKIAYTFHAPQGSTFTSAHIAPRPGYYELTRDAAKQYGPFFSRLWFKTTYLSDGQTPIMQWEVKVLDRDPETQKTCLE